jgi:hypothetical protein
MIILVIFICASQILFVGADRKLARFVYPCHTGESGNALQRAWNSQFLMAHCDQQMLCSRDFFAYAGSSKHRYLVEEFLLPGTVFFLQLDASNPADTPQVRGLLSVARTANRTLKDFVLVHLSDMQRQHTPTYKFYDEWRYVLRNFHWDSALLQEQLVGGQVTYYPLGYSHHLLADPRVANPTPIQDRVNSVAFVGNRKTGNRERARQVAEVEKALGFSVVGAVHEGSYAHGSQQLYRDALVDSKFCLVVPSRFMETGRLFDALEAGCVPVLIDRFKTYDFSRDVQEQLRPLLTFPWTDSSGLRVLLGAADGEPIVKALPEVTSSVATTSSVEEGRASGARSKTVVQRVEIVVTTPQSQAARRERVFFASSYHAFNTGAGGVSTLPFVHVASPADFALVVEKLLHDPVELQRVQRETVAWWLQVKQYYQRTVSSKLCVAVKSAV